MKKSNTPSAKGAPENQQANNNKIHLSPIQSRAVKLLLNKSCISWDLEILIHCRYAPDIIQHIRRKGIEVITTMVPHKRLTDGKTVRVGKYSIAPSSLDTARLATSD